MNQNSLYEDLKEISKKCWTRHLTPDGESEFYYNTLTEESSWEKPKVYDMKPPNVLHIKNKEKVFPSIKEESSELFCWELVFLNNNDFFWFDSVNYRSFWRIPEIIQTIYNKSKKRYKEMQEEFKRFQKERIIQQNSIPNINQYNNNDESDEEEGESDEEEEGESDEEFEIFDGETGEVSELKNNNEQVTQSTQMSNPRKRTREEEEITTFQEPKKKKQKIVKKKNIDIQNFEDLLHEFFSKGVLNENSTYQNFFRKGIRDSRFRKIRNNEKRKELFQSELQNLKK